MFFLRKIKFPLWTVPLLFLGVGVAAYGILAPLQGYYWDDWGFAWLAHFYGSDGLVEQFEASGRPWLGYFHIVTDWLVGENPLAWQLFAIFYRCLAAFSFLGMLRMVWPTKTRQATWAALLFLVYPGFSQQFIAITYSHIFIIQAVFFTSIRLTIAAIRRPDRAWLYHGAAMLLSAFNLFMVEYFVVLELLRPLLIWWALCQKAPPRRMAWGRLAKNWLPYFLVMMGYLYWRLFILSKHLYQPSFLGALKENPLAALWSIASIIPYDMFKTSLLAWMKVFEIPSIAEFGLRSSLVYWVMVAGGAISIWFYLAHLQVESRFRREDEAPGSNWQWLVTGLAALFLAGWPFWIAELEVHLVHPNDRFTLAFMPGASLLLVGLIELIPKVKWLKATILAVSVGLAVGLQFQNANLFRRDWKDQQAFFWQLAWRIPSLEPGTTILSAQMLPMYFNSDDSLTAPLNWTYAPDLQSYELPYLMLFASERPWFVSKSNLHIRDDRDLLQPARMPACFGSGVRFGYTTPAARYANGHVLIRYEPHHTGSAAGRRTSGWPFQPGAIPWLVFLFREG